MGKESYNSKRVINDIRMLGLDMINTAGSGHPGIVLGAAPMIHTLFSKHLKFNANDPKWANRDRFVLSVGHGSALLYATLFSAGYNIDLKDLRNFRNLDSKTPGHPELNVKYGIEMTTGPLGQGFASAIGMAIGAKYLNAKYREIFDYKIFTLCGDGDLMEGISYEAASLAGTLKLNNLIVLYDSNNVCLDSNTNKTFTENVINRFKALNWHTIKVNNGDSVEEIDKALIAAKKITDKPVLIEVKTIIGKYSKDEGTNQVHGTPLIKMDLENVRKKINENTKPFDYNQYNMRTYQDYLHHRNSEIYDEWQKKYLSYQKLITPNTKKELECLINNKPITCDIENIISTQNIDLEKSMREINGIIMNMISENNSLLIGGSADLASSTKTYLTLGKDFSASNYAGRNIYFGVREHAMGAILNGLALTNLKCFGSTFLTFADYLKPSIRLAALMNLPVTYIFTHDSINIGQDGPTHQPIEQLNMLRSIPNLNVYRPADYLELIGSWQLILNNPKPSVLVISRNKVDHIIGSSSNQVKYGAYIVSKEAKTANAVIIATGSEVSLAIKVKEALKLDNIDLRIVSMPNMGLFLKQSTDYQEEILPKKLKRIVLEYGSSNMWYQFTNDANALFTIDHFGLSGKPDDIIKEFELDLGSIVKKIKELLK